MPMVLVPVSSLVATFFQGPISNVDPTMEAAVPDLIAGMRESTGDLRSRILYIRERFADEDLFACQEAKEKLGCIVWSGIFSKREHTCCTAYNGLIVCDVDHHDDAAAVCERMRGKPHVVFTFLSPKGNGCKIGILTDATRPEQHKVAYATVRAHMATVYGVELDGSGSDICRACFVSYDTNAWCAEQVEPLMVDPNAAIAIESAKAGSLPPIADKITENRHQHLIVFQAKLAALGATVPVLIAAGRAFADDRLDCSDGRVIPDDEIRRGAEGAYAKYHRGDHIAAIVHGMNVAATWKMEAAEREKIRAEVLAEIPKAAPMITTAVPVAEPSASIQGWPAHLVNPDTWGGAIGACMRGIIASSVRQQPALALACALNMVGTVLGRQVQGPSGLRTNLYNIGICDTGGGKESALKFAKRMFYAANINQRYLQPEVIASDAAVETHTRQKPSGLWLLDEFGRYLQSMSGSNAAAHQSNILTIWLALYTKADDIYLGKAYGDVKREVEPIIQPCVNIYGTCNPVDLHSALRGSDITNGFLPRLMVFYADRNLPERTPPAGAADIDQQLIDWFTLWGNNESALARITEPCPVAIPNDPDADKLWNEFSNEIDRARRAPGVGLIANAVYSRSAEKAARVALIVAAGRATPDDIATTKITAADMQTAIDLIRYLDARLISAAADNISNSAEERESKDLQRIIDHAMFAGVSKSSLIKMTRKKSTVLNALLDVLLDAGVIVSDYVGDGQRKSLYYFGAQWRATSETCPEEASAP